MVLTDIRSGVRHGVRRFFEIIDSEVVGIFQAVVYLHVLVGGFYGALIAGGTPEVLEKAMGHTVSGLWLYLCMGSAICLFGKQIMQRLENIGVWLQLTGDIFVLGALSAYVAATLQGAYWGKELFAVFIVASIAECVVLLIIRDIRRIVQIEKAHRPCT